MQSLNWIERLVIAVGCGSLAVAGTRVIEAASFQRAASQTLQRELAAASAQVLPTAPGPFVTLPAGEEEPPAVVRAEPWEGGPVGRLDIPRVHLSVIVAEGDDDATLARAVGHLPGTAFPWNMGNVVLAGHRDTFFRPLQKLHEGDEIRLTTAHGTFAYRVTRMEIVDPSDISVVAPTPGRSLTLITCYPFIYVGSAPERFIVHAR